MAPSVGTLIWMPVYLRPHIASTLLGQSTSAVADKVIGHAVYFSVCKHHSLFDL
jgi:hypothetical protein